MTLSVDPAGDELQTVISGVLCQWGFDGSHNGSCEWVGSCVMGHAMGGGSCVLRVITWVGSCVRGSLHGWGHVWGSPI